MGLSALHGGRWLVAYRDNTTVNVAIPVLYVRWSSPRSVRGVVLVVRKPYERRFDYPIDPDFAIYGLEAMIMVEIQGRCRICNQPCCRTKVGALCDESLCGCHA